MQMAPGWIAPDFAARLPFGLMLVLVLVATWYGIYQLARSPGAQPVAFAFGGEAQPADYARAMADGGLLGLIGCLGLAQLSHETTPALAQLCFTALTFYGLSALSGSLLVPLAAIGAGLTGLTLSGAPAVAVLFGLGGAIFGALERNETGSAHGGQLWRIAGPLAAATAAAALASSLDLWQWRIAPPGTSWREWRSLGRLFLWFTWPLWPLVLWTLWRWRHQLRNLPRNRHLAWPLLFLAVAMGTTLLTPASDRSLLLALPALATLAAFALPTLERSVSALIDWFTLLFFSGCAIVIWVIWVSMQAGVPKQPAANVAKLAPGFEPSLSGLAFVAALGGPSPFGHLEKHGAAGRRRDAVLAAADDSVVAGSGLCAQLCTDGATHSGADQPPELRAGPWHEPRPAGGFALPRKDEYRVRRTRCRLPLAARRCGRRLEPAASRRSRPMGIPLPGATPDRPHRDDPDLPARCCAVKPAPCSS